MPTSFVPNRVKWMVPKWNWAQADLLHSAGQVLQLLQGCVTSWTGHCRWRSLFSANTVSCSIGPNVNLRKYKHQNVPIAYPNSKYKCRQFTQFSMGTKNKQSSAKCLVLVDKLQAYWSCSLTKLYWRLAPPQLTAARRRRHCRGGLNSLYRTYRASTMVVLGEFLSKNYLIQLLILGFLILVTNK